MEFWHRFKQKLWILWFAGWPIVWAIIKALVKDDVSEKVRAAITGRSGLTDGMLALLSVMAENPISSSILIAVGGVLIAAAYSAYESRSAKGKLEPVGESMPGLPQSESESAALRSELIALKDLRRQELAAAQLVTISKVTWGNKKDRESRLDVVLAKPRNALAFFVNNDELGGIPNDPAPGDDDKFVEIEYAHKGKGTRTVTRKQGQWVVIPEDSWLLGEAECLQSDSKTTPLVSMKQLAAELRLFISSHRRSQVETILAGSNALTEGLKQNAKISGEFAATYAGRLAAIMAQIPTDTELTGLAGDFKGSDNVMRIADRLDYVARVSERPCITGDIVEVFFQDYLSGANPDNFADSFITMKVFLVNESPVDTSVKDWKLVVTFGGKSYTTTRDYLANRFVIDREPLEKMTIETMMANTPEEIEDLEAVLRNQILAKGIGKTGWARFMISTEGVGIDELDGAKFSFVVTDALGRAHAIVRDAGLLAPVRECTRVAALAMHRRLI